MKNLNLALASLACAAFTAVPQAHAEYYNFNTQDGADILYQETRYPYWAESTYNARYYGYVNGAAGRSVFFYSGPNYQTPNGVHAEQGTKVNGYIWSFWPVSNPVTAGDSVVPGMWHPPFYDVPSVGEGASGKVETRSLSMSTGVWYSSALRVWQPSGNPANQGRVGQWLRDGQTGEWKHMATMNVPFVPVGFSGTMSGFMEDFWFANANPRRVEFRNFYSRKGTWQAAKVFKPSTRVNGTTPEKGTSGTMENGTVGFFETCSGASYTGNMGPGNDEKTYTLNTPDSPAFDALVVNGVTAVATANQVHVKWNLPATSAPQFAYKVDVFPTSDTSGAPAVTRSLIEPDVRECVIATGNLATPTVRVTITDIFDRTSTPIVVAASAAVLANASSPAGTVAGLNYKYYETSLSALPNFATLSSSLLKFQGAVNLPDLTVRKKHTSYACQYTGFVNVPADGVWLFSLASCDGSRLLVNGSVVIDNDGTHSGGIELSGTAALKAGKHAVELQYFKDSNTSGDNDHLRLSWEGPGVAKTQMREACWSRIPAAGEPVVQLTSPATGTTIPAANVPLTATVSANGNPLNSVRFFQNDTVWANKTGTSSPFSTTTLLGAGANHLKARLIYGVNGDRSLDSPPVDITAVQPVTSPWNFSSLGLHAFPSASGYQAGTWSMVGDGMNFTWQEITGDETIVARVAGKPGTGDQSQFDGIGPDGSWCGGVIFRENLAPNPGIEWGNRFVTLYQEVNGATRLQSSDDENQGGYVVGPNLGSNYSWFKLQRAGNLFTAWLSTDGANWTQVGTRTMASAFGAKMYVGVFTLARPSTNPNPHWWKFDNVAFASVGNGFQITRHPQSQNVFAGAKVTFSVAATSNVPLTYQWQREGVDIPGATFSTLTLDQVKTSDAGNYRVVVSNGASTSNSNVAALTVKPSNATGYQRAIEIQGPVAYWRLNETSGTVINDAIGGFNASVGSGVTLNQAGPRSPAFPAFESTNQAVTFASGGRITAPALNLNTNAMTITGWVKRSGNVPSFSGIVFSRAGNTVAGLTFGNNNELRYTWNNSGGTYGWNSGLVVPDNQWTFVALVIEPTRAIMHMDSGSGLLSSTNVIAHPIQEFDGALCIGQDTSSNDRSFINGCIDEVAIFNRSLTPAEIASIASPPPAVGISATIPNAAERNAVAGQFTVTRSGAPLANPLTVGLAIAGTATPGADYSAISNSITIPAGASSASIVVSPLGDALAEGPETVLCGLAYGDGYYVSASASATVTIQDLPMDDWRYARFGANANNPQMTADNADPDNDRVPNLLEYAFAGHPLTHDPVQLPVASIEDGNLVLVYRKKLNAPDITYQVQQSTLLGSWSAAAPAESVLSDNGEVRVIKATVPKGADPKKFLRVLVTRP